MDPNQGFYFFCFFKGILAMREPPVPRKDAEAIERKPHWTSRIFTKFRRAQRAPAQKTVRTEQC